MEAAVGPPHCPFLQSHLNLCPPPPAVLAFQLAPAVAPARPASGQASSRRWGFSLVLMKAPLSVLP